MQDTDSSISTKAAVLLSLVFATFATGCVVEPSEGYYDRDHHRYYHDHTWVTCDADGDDCRTHHDHEH
jgi:hypothetical protein